MLTSGLHARLYTHTKKGKGVEASAEGVGMAPQGRVLLWAAQPLEAAEGTIARGGSVPEQRARRSQRPGARAAAIRVCLCSGSDWRQETGLSQGQGSLQDHMEWKLGQEGELVQTLL